jgi:hypothetical protein
MIKAFNDPQNKFGDYIRVIFGTDKTTEGITLKNIQQIHIVTPGWNFGKKNQATGRGIRYGSHDALQKAGVKVQVDVFLHCVIPDSQIKEPMKNSISFLQYSRSEFKENNILFFMYQLLINAVDCQLNYYQNFQEFAKNFTASCYFQPCKYPCVGITKPDPTELFYGNYNTFYADNNTYVPKIIKMYNHNNSPKTFEAILELLDAKKDIYLVYNALQIIINTPMQIFLNGPYFLMEQSGIFYCSPSMDVLRWNSTPVISTLTGEPNFILPDTTHSVMEKLYYRSEKYLTDKMLRFQSLLDSKKVAEFVRMYQSFPTSIQSMIVDEKPDLSILQGIEWVPKREKWITKDRKFELDNRGNIKKVLSEKEKQISQEELLKNNPYGVYAIVTKSGLKIRDISSETKKGTTKSKTKGQLCPTIDVEQIIYYIFLLQDSNDEQWKAYIPPSKLHLYEERLPLILESKNIEKDFVEQQRIFKKLWGKSLSKSQMQWFLILKSAGSTRQSLCSYLLELLRKQNLVITEKLS